MRLFLLVIAGLLASQQVFAEESLKRSTVGMSWSDVEVSVDGLSGAAEGSGWEFGGRIGSSWPFATLSYGESDGDGRIGGQPSAFDSETASFGLGAYVVDTANLLAWLRTSYIRELSENTNNDDSYGLFTGLDFGTLVFTGSAEFGLIQNDDGDTGVFSIGASYNPGQYGFALNYTLSKFDPDNGGREIEGKALSLSALWHF